MGLPNFSLLVLYVSHIMKSVESSSSQLLFKLNGKKFFGNGAVKAVI